jgi:hypothetical protein
MIHRNGYKSTMYIERSGGGYHAIVYDQSGEKRHFGHTDKDECLALATRASGYQRRQIHIVDLAREEDNMRALYLAARGW